MSPSLLTPKNWASTALPHPMHEHMAARIKMTIEALQAAISCLSRASKIWIG